MNWTRRLWIASIVFVLVAAAASAQTGYSSAKATGKTEQEVKAAQQQLLNAAIQGDKDAVGNLIADNLSWVSTSGKISGKDELLGTLPAPVHDVTGVEVRPLGNIAILTGVAHLNNGPDVRFLQEWVNRDGQWKLMAHEGAAIASPSETGTSGTMGMKPPTGTAGKGEAPAPKAGGSAPTLSSDDERAVWKTQTDLQQAFLKGDAATYSKLTSDNYVRIAQNGEQLGKSQFLQTVRQNAKQSPGQLETSDAQIVVNGDTARLVMETSGTLPGGQQSPPSRVTRIFAKRNGQWQQVAAIFTPISEQ